MDIKEKKLKCKLCGKVLGGVGVELFMQHLLLEHNLTFLERVEQIFYDKI